MHVDESADSYNLLDKPFIPVLWMDGRSDPHRVGIREALTKAGSIRQIAASNPMDNVALLRFLLAVLQWCKCAATQDDLQAIARDESAGVPASWLDECLGPQDKPNPVFDLLGETARFYQDRRLLHELLEAKQRQWETIQARRKGRSAPKTPRPPALAPEDYRPIGDLLQEFPTETKVAHFRHVRDRQYGLCPACCAMGIVRFCAFANAYGGGRYTSAVNGPTPAYAIRQGQTLLHTIAANWPKDRAGKRAPPWLCDDAPSGGDLDVITVFAWRSRRLWLGDCGTEDEPCSYCGEPARLIRLHAFTGNWEPPFQIKGKQKKFWDQDPHLIIEMVAKAKADSDETGEAPPADLAAQGEEDAKAQQVPTTVGFPAPSAPVTAHARFWRRVLSAKLRVPGDTAGGEAPLAMAVGGPAANKGLYQDSVALHLLYPARGATEYARAALHEIDELSKALVGLLRRSTPNPDRIHPERKALLDGLAASHESALHRLWRGFLEPLHNASPEQRRATAAAWGNDMRGVCCDTVRAAVQATTPGSPLRRQEALRQGECALDDAIGRVRVDQPGEAASKEKAHTGEAGADTPAVGKERKSRRGGKKGGAK